mgnify:CR=1 FL=1
MLCYANNHTLLMVSSISITVQQFVSDAFSILSYSGQVVEDGYEFFAKRQLVTLFSAPNYCGEFDNAGGMMSVDETLMCSFQVILMYFTTLQDENI